MKIIAAVDGTPNSEAALDALVGMNLPTDTEIKLVTVVRSDETPLSFLWKGSSKGSLQQEFVEASENALNQMVVELGKLIKGCKISAEVLQGDAKTQITEAAKKWGADLIIMGSRGNRGVDLIVLGSVSQGVIMQSPCPVIVVKPDDEYDLQKGFKNIIIAVDNSSYSQAALDWLKKFTWSSDTAFKLITVVPPLSDAISDVGDVARTSELSRQHEATINSAKQELQAVANELAKTITGGNISIEVGEGDPREAVLQMATVWGADLIVMGSHGRTGLTKLLIGSVSQAVALQSQCSVAIIRGLLPKGAGSEWRKTGRFAVVSPEQLVRKASAEDKA